MKLTGDQEMQEWLATQPAFQWDAGNQMKSMEKHGNSCEAIEAIVEGPMVFAGRIVEPAHKEPRYLLLGVSKTGKRLALIFTRRGDLLRPISCRAMRKNEEAVYVEATGN